MADPIERPPITVNPVLVAAHFNQVVLTVWETGGVLACEAALSIGIKNAVRFQCSNHSAAFFHGLIPQTLAGIPAVHQGDNGDVGFRQMIKELNRHVDFRAVFRATAAQFITKSGISCADMSAEYLIPKDLLPLQMRVMPSGSLRGMFRL